MDKLIVWPEEGPFARTQSVVHSVAMWDRACVVD